ncbi:MAG: hypothetical protein HOV87_31895, partial [Catenulispora sp.]|nr:hypothetical protein [Catenulispora sp.]
MSEEKKVETLAHDIEAEVLRGVLRAEPFGALSPTPAYAATDQLATGPALSIGANFAARAADPLSASGATDVATDVAADPATGLATDLVTDLTTDLTTDLATGLATDQATDLATDLSTALASGPSGTGQLALLLDTVLDGLDRGRADWL